MSPLVRRIVAVIAALVGASVIVMGFEYLGAKLFPVAGIDPTDRAQVEGAVRAGLIPTGAMVMVAAGWVVAAFIGGTVALKVSREGGAAPTRIFAALFTLACVANLVMFPHPPWMWFAGVVMVPLAAIVAGRDRSAA